MSAPANLPAWLEPAPRRKPQPMHVSVTTDVGSRFEYEAAFPSTFDAYDDALDRFHGCTRIEVKPTRKGAGHGA